MFVDPIELGLELFGGEPDGAQHPKAAGLADSDHHVTTVGESEYRKLESQSASQFGLH